MHNEPSVAVVLLNWNGFDITSECIESLMGLDYGNYKIVLVDNGSYDEEGKKLKEKFPEIHLIANKENKGFTGGNNDGISWAKNNGYESIWILNNDTIVDKNALKIQVQHFEDDKIGAVGSKILLYNSDIIWSKGIYFVKLIVRPLKLYFFSNIDEGKKDVAGESPRKVDYISGCSMLIRSNMENILFDDDFFATCEDMELSYRIRKEGYDIIYEPASRVYHKNAQSWGGEKFNKYTAYFSYRGKLMFTAKTRPAYYLILIFPLYVVCLLRDSFRIMAYCDNKKDLFRSMFKGIRDGMRFIISKNAKVAIFNNG